jgi:hypothetical protein
MPMRYDNAGDGSPLYGPQAESACRTLGGRMGHYGATTGGRREILVPICEGATV